MESIDLEKRAKRNKRIAAIFVLAIFFVLMIGLLFSLITANGKLAFALVIGLIFFSIVMYLVLGLFKRNNKK